MLGVQRNEVWSLCFFSLISSVPGGALPRTWISSEAPEVESSELVGSSLTPNCHQVLLVLAKISTAKDSPANTYFPSYLEVTDLKLPNTEVKVGEYLPNQASDLPLCWHQWVSSSFYILRRNLRLDNYKCWVTSA